MEGGACSINTERKSKSSNVSLKSVFTGLVKCFVSLQSNTQSQNLTAISPEDSCSVDL